MMSEIFAHKEWEIQHNCSSDGLRAVETPEDAVLISPPDSHVAIATLAATDDEQFQSYLAKTRRALPDTPMPSWYRWFLSELFRVRAKHRKPNKEQRRREAERRAVEKAELKARTLAAWPHKRAMPALAGAT